MIARPGAYADINPEGVDVSMRTRSRWVVEFPKGDLDNIISQYGELPLPRNPNFSGYVGLSASDISKLCLKVGGTFLFCPEGTSTAPVLLKVVPLPEHSAHNVAMMTQRGRSFVASNPSARVDIPVSFVRDGGVVQVIKRHVNSGGLANDGFVGGRIVTQFDQDLLDSVTDTYGPTDQFRAGGINGFNATDRAHRGFIAMSRSDLDGLGVKEGVVVDTIMLKASDSVAVALRYVDSGVADGSVKITKRGRLHLGVDESDDSSRTEFFSFEHDGARIAVRRHSTARNVNSVIG